MVRLLSVDQFYKTGPRQSDAKEQLVVIVVVSLHPFQLDETVTSLHLLVSHQILNLNILRFLIPPKYEFHCIKCFLVLLFFFFYW